VRMLKLVCVLSAALGLGGVTFSEPAKAAAVDYTLTFTGTDGTKADGTGTLVINETSPLNSFTENSVGDIVSLQVKIGGLTYNFSPSSFAADIGTNQTFYSLTGSSLGVTGPTGLVLILRTPVVPILMMESSPSVRALPSPHCLPHGP
jgi:hypothetical protein